MRHVGPALLLGVVLLVAPSRMSGANEEAHGASQESLRGKVVWLADALKSRHGIESDADAAKTYCALVTVDGQILPIVKDARGRGFWLDPRIRDIDVELLTRRLPGTSMIQVIRVYTLKDDGKYEMDYWCDVCSIPMFELKACECCQGPTRIRERRVGPRDESK